MIINEMNFIYYVIKSVSNKILYINIKNIDLWEFKSKLFSWLKYQMKDCLLA